MPQAETIFIAQTISMKFESLIPILYSADLAQSFSYYTEKLGFEKRWDWGEPPGFGCVGRDNVEIFFCLKNQGNPGTWLCINLQEVDEYYEFIKSKGATILSPPENKEWLMREMLVQDPDGNRIRFGHSIDCD